MRTGQIAGVALVSLQLAAHEGNAADQSAFDLGPVPLRTAEFQASTNAPGEDPRTLEALIIVRTLNAPLESRFEAFTTLDFSNAVIPRDTAGLIAEQITVANLLAKAIGDPYPKLEALRAKPKLSPSEQLSARKFESDVREKGQSEQIVNAGLRILVRNAFTNDDLLADFLQSPNSVRAALHALDPQSTYGAGAPGEAAALGPKTKAALGEAALSKDPQVQLEALFVAMNRGLGDIAVDGAKSFAAALSGDLEKGKGPALEAMRATFGNIEHPSSGTPGPVAAVLQPTIERMIKSKDIDIQSAGIRALATFHTDFSSGLATVKSAFEKHPDKLAGSVGIFLFNSVQFRHRVPVNEAIGAAKTMLASPIVSDRYVGTELFRQISPSGAAVPELAPEMEKLRVEYAARDQRGEKFEGLEGTVARNALRAPPTARRN